MHDKPGTEQSSHGARERNFEGPLLDDMYNPSDKLAGKEATTARRLRWKCQ